MSEAPPPPCLWAHRGEPLLALWTSVFGCPVTNPSGGPEFISKVGRGSLTQPPRTIVPKEFPELALLVWNRDPTRSIAADEAFALYERNWRHVDKNRLTPREHALIHALAAACGHGHMLI